MNPHFHSPRAGDNFLRLAGLADGELDADTRRQLELWLENHPAAHDEFHDQERFSPTQMEFWSAVVPPEPSAADWLRVQSRIERELAVKLPNAGQLLRDTIPRIRSAAQNHRRTGIRRVAVTVGALVASLILVWAWPMTKPNPAEQAVAVVVPAPAPAPVQMDPLADIPVLHMASRADVVVEAVYGTLPVGFLEYDSPCVEEFQFATAGELEVERMENTEPGVKVSLTASDSGMPMIYAVVQIPPDERP